MIMTQMNSKAYSMILFCLLVGALRICVTQSFTMLPVQTCNKQSTYLKHKNKSIDSIAKNQIRHSKGIHVSMLPETTSFLSVVEVFDGSTIVDPVVVSDVFWGSLKGKIFALILGQFLASIAFGFISWLVTSQLSRLGKTFFSSSSSSKTSDQPRTFRRADEIPSFNAPPPDLGKLLICLTIDIVGSSSELIPLLGELTDVIYAPVAATILRNLYGSNNILFGLEFAEEILPFTDILPLATICWVVDTYFRESEIAKLLKLGVYSPKAVEDAIDTTASSSSSSNIYRDDKTFPPR